MQEDYSWYLPVKYHPRSHPYHGVSFYIFLAVFLLPIPPATCPALTPYCTMR